MHAGIYFEMEHNGGEGESRKTSQVFQTDNAERYIREAAFKNGFDGCISDDEDGGQYPFVAKYERLKIRIYAKEGETLSVEHLRDRDEPVSVRVAFQYGSDRNARFQLLKGF